MTSAEMLKKTIKPNKKNLLLSCTIFLTAINCAATIHQSKFYGAPLMGTCSSDSCCQTRSGIASAR